MSKHWVCIVCNSDLSADEGRYSRGPMGAACADCEVVALTKDVDALWHALGTALGLLRPTDFSSGPDQDLLAHARATHARWTEVT